MNLYQFNMINKDDKLKSVWKHGTFIDNYITDTEKTNLYGIDKFYVDVVYDADTNEIVEVRSFKTGKCLEKYFPEIQVEY
jgi:hypothetical protein